MSIDREMGVYRWDGASSTVDLRDDAPDSPAGRRRQSAP
jgi:hypothetical protein